MVRGVLGVVTALAVVLAVSLIATGHSSRHGCIYVTIPAATGAEEINQCGQTARSTCLSASVPGAYSAQSARSIEDACRKAGLPVG
jgi:hypothetical protein